MEKRPNPDKFITTAEVNKISIKIFDLKIKQVNLAINTALNTNNAEIEKKRPDIANFLSKTEADFIIKDEDKNQEEIKILKLKSIKNK